MPVEAPEGTDELGVKRAVRDFAAFSKQTGHSLLESSEANKEFFFFLKKK